jgi:drug/metabolite transporter (DMT)-like permease
VCFAALDATAKIVSPAVPLFLLIWVRFMVQALVATATLLPRRGLRLMHTRYPGLQVSRALIQVLASACGFLSLRFMPLGEYTAIVLLTPLVLTLLAATMLGEQVPWTRWMLLTTGLAGALMVIRPGTGLFRWVMLLPLALVLVNAIFHIMTSKLAQVDDGHTTQFYSGWVGAIAAGLVVPFVWEPVPWQWWAGILLLGAFSTMGHFLLIQAYIRAPVAALTPYLYLQIAFATLAGWIVFAHFPDAWAIAGIVLIALCGVAGTIPREWRAKCAGAPGRCLEALRALYRTRSRV